MGVGYTAREGEGQKGQMTVDAMWALQRPLFRTCQLGQLQLLEKGVSLVRGCFARG